MNTQPQPTEPTLSISKEVAALLYPSQPIPQPERGLEFFCSSGPGLPYMSQPTSKFASSGTTKGEFENSTSKASQHKSGSGSRSILSILQEKFKAREVEATETAEPTRAAGQEDQVANPEEESSSTTSDQEKREFLQQEIGTIVEELKESSMNIAQPSGPDRAITLNETIARLKKLTKLDTMMREMIEEVKKEAGLRSEVDATSEVDYESWVRSKRNRRVGAGRSGRTMPLHFPMLTTGSEFLVERMKPDFRTKSVLSKIMVEDRVGKYFKKLASMELRRRRFRRTGTTAQLLFEILEPTVREFIKQFIMRALASKFSAQALELTSLRTMPMETTECFCSDSKDQLGSMGFFQNPKTGAHFFQPPPVHAQTRQRLLPCFPQQALSLVTVANSIAFRHFIKAQEDRLTYVQETLLANKKLESLSNSSGEDSGDCLPSEKVSVKEWVHRKHLNSCKLDKHFRLEVERVEYLRLYRQQQKLLEEQRRCDRLQQLRQQRKFAHQEKQFITECNILQGTAQLADKKDEEDENRKGKLPTLGFLIDPLRKKMYSRNKIAAMFMANQFSLAQKQIIEEYNLAPIPKKYKLNPFKWEKNVIPTSILQEKEEYEQAQAKEKKQKEEKEAKRKLAAKLEEDQITTMSQISQEQYRLEQQQESKKANADGEEKTKKNKKKKNKKKKKRRSPLPSEEKNAERGRKPDEKSSKVEMSHQSAEKASSKAASKVSKGSPAAVSKPRSKKSDKAGHSEELGKTRVFVKSEMALASNLKSKRSSNTKESQVRKESQFTQKSDAGKRSAQSQLVLPPSRHRPVEVGFIEGNRGPIFDNAPLEPWDNPPNPGSKESEQQEKQNCRKKNHPSHRRHEASASISKGKKCLNSKGLTTTRSDWRNSFSGSKWNSSGSSPSSSGTSCGESSPKELKPEMRNLMTPTKQGRPKIKQSFGNLSYKESLPPRNYFIPTKANLESLYMRRPVPNDPEWIRHKFTKKEHFKRREAVAKDQEREENVEKTLSKMEKDWISYFGFTCRSKLKEIVHSQHLLRKRELKRLKKGIQQSSAVPHENWPTLVNTSLKNLKFTNEVNDAQISFIRSKIKCVQEFQNLIVMHPSSLGRGYDRTKTMSSLHQIRKHLNEALDVQVHLRTGSVRIQDAVVLLRTVTTSFQARSMSSHRGRSLLDFNRGRDHRSTSEDAHFLGASFKISELLGFKKKLEQKAFMDLIHQTQMKLKQRQQIRHYDDDSDISSDLSMTEADEQKEQAREESFSTVEGLGEEYFGDGQEGVEDDEDGEEDGEEEVEDDQEGEQDDEEYGEGDYQEYDLEYGEENGDDADAEYEQDYEDLAETYGGAGDEPVGEAGERYEYDENG